MSRPAPRAVLVCALGAALALLAVPGRASAHGPRVPVPMRAGALYAPATGQFLYADHARTRRAIASTTKLMTALVTLEHVHDLDTVFTYPDYHQAADDSQIGLRPGDRMTVHDLIIAMMLPSADDAAEDLAENVGHGSVARFVGWMNDAARRLHLRHTHYTTPIGLDSAGNYSTAEDLARLAADDLARYPFLARVVKMSHAALATGPVREVTNLNLLVGEYPWITGVKTGHTNDAGYVLVASGRRDGLQLIASALGAQTETGRDADALSLLDYGYANFALRTPIHAQQIVARLPVRDRPGLRVPVRAARSWRRVLARGDRVQLRVDVPRRLAGPLPAGAVVGSAVLLDGARALARVPVVLERRLPAVSALTIAVRFVTQPWMLAIIVVAAVALLVGGLAAAGRRRSGGGGGRGSGRAPASSLGPGFGSHP